MVNHIWPTIFVKVEDGKIFQNGSGFHENINYSCRFLNSICKKSVALEIAYAEIQNGGSRIAYASALK